MQPERLEDLIKPKPSSRGKWAGRWGKVGNDQVEQGEKLLARWRDTIAAGGSPESYKWNKDAISRHQRTLRANWFN